ncbi:MAG: dockerin type I domain-containing protein, partial [Pirellula sp.]
GLDIADVAILDDALGINAVSLSGPDATMFEVVSGKLKLKPSQLDFETKRTLRVTVAVDDPAVGATPDQSIDVVLSVTDVNEAPGLTLANVVASVPESNTSGLDIADVAIVDDALGTNAISLIGPDAAKFELVSGKLKLKPSQLDFETKRTLRVTVAVDDPTVGTTPDQSIDVVLSVTDVNEAPGLALANVVASVPESNTSGLDIADVSILDDALGTNAISLSGADATKFEVVSGKLKLKPSQLDFETKPILRVTVSVDDPTVGATPDQSIDVVLNVTDVNEAPGLTLTNVASSVPESNTSGFDVADVAILDDALGINAVSLSGPDATMFEVVSGKLKLKPSQLDFETKPTLRVTVAVDDPTVGQTPDQSIDVVLNVTDVNEAPGLTLTNVVSSVPESNTSGLDIADVSILDDALGANTISLSGADATKFEVVSGKLKLKPGQLDFETKPVLRVTVSVDDPAVGTTPDQSIDLVLNVTDVNEAPGLALANVVASVPESNTSGLDIADVLILDDALGANVISLSGADASKFEVVSGKLKLKPSQLDFETNPVLRVTVSVDDPSVGTTPDQFIEVVLNVTDVNEAPGLTLTNVVTSVPESNTSGLDVADVSILDDAIGTNTISLSGPDATKFDVVSGKLKLKPSQLDFETKPTLRVTVAVDDPTVGATPDQSIDVVLNVTDVNEAPGLMLSNVVSSVPESNTTGLDVADVAIFDDSLGTNAISLSGADATRFEVVSGKLKLKPSQLDFETKPVLRVTVSVDDPAVGATPDKSLDVVLNVTDINEAPTEIVFGNLISSFPEEEWVIQSIAVASIAIVDDALGDPEVSLQGADAEFFEIADGKLWLRSGARFDFESQSALHVRVIASDPLLQNSTPVFRDYVVSVVNVPEVTSVRVVDGDGWNASVKQIRIAWDTLVSFSGPAIQWLKQDVGGEVVPFQSIASNLDNKTVVDLRFEGKFVDDVGLLDGNYQLKVDGTQVHSLDAPFHGVNFAESFIAFRPKPAATLDVSVSSVVGIGVPVSIDMRLVGDSFAGNDVQYDMDLNADGLTDRVVVGGAIVSVKDVIFGHGGNRTITAKASRNGVALAQGSAVVDVVPYTTHGTTWISTLDVDADSTISPLDVLSVINWLNKSSSARQYELNLDVDRDSSISPLDVLAIINHVNSNQGSAPPTPFVSLIMNDTGASDGLTTDIGFRGAVRDAHSKLSVSLDGSPRKEIVGAIGPNGQFEVTDLAISQLFGDSLNGDHTLTVGAIGTDGVWRGMDRRFTRTSQRLLTPEIRTALQQNGLELQWTSAGNGARYRVMSVRFGLPPVQLAIAIAGLSTRLDLPKGDYEIYVEAYDHVGQSQRSQTVKVVID